MHLIPLPTQSATAPKGHPMSISASRTVSLKTVSLKTVSLKTVSLK